MKKIYEKSEIWFAVGWILIYVLLMGNLEANFGRENVITFLGLLIFVGVLTVFFVKNDLLAKYGFCKVREYKKYWFFLPLLLIGTVNLWFGVKMNYGMKEQLIAFGTMFLSGFAEEYVFRGLLFRAIQKESTLRAVIITSVTFGLGHIVNLFTGAATLETVLQMIYAIAIGFAFVLVLYRSGSIWPCIITHVLINTTAEFSREGSEVLTLIQVAFLIVVSVVYALYLAKMQDKEK